MLKIVLVLPGATDYLDQGRIQGSLNIPLNARGHQEVAQMAGELRSLGIEAVYCSPCESAVQSATELASAIEVKAKPIDDFMNLNHGLWQGMQMDEVKHKQPKVYRQWQEQPDSVCPPGGETLDDVRQRVRACLTRLFKKHRNGVIALTVPEPLASIVREQFGSGLGDLWQACAQHGRWEVLQTEPTVLASQTTK